MPLIDIVGWVFFGIVVCCIIAGAIIFVKKVTLYPEDNDDDREEANMADTAINQEDCLHCFCHQDTGKNWYCCRCGKLLDNKYQAIFYPFDFKIEYPHYFYPITIGG